MDVEGLLDAAEGITIMSSREVVSFPRVNIANMMESFCRGSIKIWNWIRERSTVIWTSSCYTLYTNANFF